MTAVIYQKLISTMRSRHANVQRRNGGSRRTVNTWGAASLVIAAPNFVRRLITLAFALVVAAFLAACGSNQFASCQIRQLRRAGAGTQNSADRQMFYEARAYRSRHCRILGRSPCRVARRVTNSPEIPAGRKCPEFDAPEWGAAGADEGEEDEVSVANSISARPSVQAVWRRRWTKTALEVAEIIEGGRNRELRRTDSRAGGVQVGEWREGVVFRPSLSPRI